MTDTLPRRLIRWGLYPASWAALAFGFHRILAWGEDPRAVWGQTTGALLLDYLLEEFTLRYQSRWSMNVVVHGRSEVLDCQRRCCGADLGGAGPFHHHHSEFPSGSGAELARGGAGRGCLADIRGHQSQPAPRYAPGARPRRSVLVAQTCRAPAAAATLSCDVCGVSSTECGSNSEACDYPAGLGDGAYASGCGEVSDDKWHAWISGHFHVDIRAGWLNYLFVGPELHRNHHSARVEEPGNFGATLAVFDSLFGSFVYRPASHPPIWE